MRKAKTTTVYFPDGKFKCEAWVVKDMREFLSQNVCSNCVYKGAIKWNPFNKVIQCHNCGQAYIEEFEPEKVEFT